MIDDLINIITDKFKQYNYTIEFTCDKRRRHCYIHKHSDPSALKVVGVISFDNDCLKYSFVVNGTFGRYYITTYENLNVDKLVMCYIGVYGR